MPLFAKICRCVKERRLPWCVMVHVRYIANKIVVGFYVLEVRFSTIWHNWRASPNPSSGTRKFLYVSAVGKEGEKILVKAINRFGHEDFDYLIFVYDGTPLCDEVFSKCRIVYEPGIKWQFLKKYLTPATCRDYEYIFIWDDDVDVEEFSYKNFVATMRRNNLDLAQPALLPGSFYSHELTVRNKQVKVGRYVDFVEVMAMVFRQEAWPKFHAMLAASDNPWGWGYDVLAKSVCRYANMGIVDAECVTHTRPVRSQYTSAPEDMRRLFRQFDGYRLAKKISYLHLK